MLHGSLVVRAVSAARHTTCHGSSAATGTGQCARRAASMRQPRHTLTALQAGAPTRSVRFPPHPTAVAA
ncbi:hypothetical protein I4F81_012900 [Pyropia yezoensis]|uniref:Uncharacterized protein n=1 Tax=Pyropia yezoensis TaxID=2788 RepID=A0ACC3CK90_PYRYE|nr:hypothetical protein I4F81_012900 [Neopyropia yezoensis]